MSLVVSPKKVQDSRIPIKIPESKLTLAVAALTGAIYLQSDANFQRTDLMLIGVACAGTLAFRISQKAFAVLEKIDSELSDFGC